MRAATLLLPLLLGSCFQSRLFLDNETNAALVPYPVVTSPPPPHREAAPGQTVAPGGRFEIDTEGFNPLFYTSAPLDPATPNGVFVGLDLHDADPPLVLIRLFHYAVAPGMEGSDPALQPLLLRERAFEITDDDHVVRVVQGGPGDLPVDVRVEPVP